MHMWMHLHRKFSYSHVQNMLQPHRQLMKLRNINIKTKVLIKINLELHAGMMCVELRAKKLRNVYWLPWMYEYTHTEVTNTLSSVYTTLDYEYGHKNKGTGLVLVLRKCGMHKLDQESYKMCTVPINVKYTLNAHPHAHRSHQLHVHCLHYSRLWV